MYPFTFPARGKKNAHIRLTQSIFRKGLTRGKIYFIMGI
ncbi:hypothetical protein B4135_3005 [Caldibacillus debilis]|uniref:Uncharacterized protein n=1 Tax=Caldibacillus debilis TaxID=301148 RepID=A0A150LLC2_9BACI|nr:hypothetical protein B4135_3005 [Caldibacillus debilis]